MCEKNCLRNFSSRYMWGFSVGILTHGVRNTVLYIYIYENWGVGNGWAWCFGGEKGLLLGI